MAKRGRPPKMKTIPSGDITGIVESSFKHDSNKKCPKCANGAVIINSNKTKHFVCPHRKEIDYWCEHFESITIEENKPLA